MTPIIVDPVFFPKPDMSRVTCMSPDDQEEYRRRIVAMCTAANQFIETNTMQSLWMMLQDVRDVLNLLGYRVPYSESIDGSATSDAINVKAVYVEQKVGGGDDYKYIRMMLNAFDRHQNAKAVATFVRSVMEIRHHEDVKRLNWRQSIATLIEEGEMLNVHVAYRERLEQLMRSMSENILEAPTHDATTTTDSGT